MLYSNDDHKYAFDPPSFKIVKISYFPFTFDVEKDSNNEYDQFYEPHVSQVIIIPPVSNPIPSKFPYRYKPLKLSPVLHEFPVNKYKYLPMFYGGFDKILAKKHIQDFEHFLDLFEVEQDDVCMRAFCSIITRTG